MLQHQTINAPRHVEAAKTLSRLDARRPSIRTLSTGIDALDALLPQRGVACGHLTQLVGCRGSGRTTLILAIVAGVAERGERSAIIDLEGDLDPVSLAETKIPPELAWVVMPRQGRDALWAADVLLRSGHFRLVVLDGLESGVRTASLVRLQRLARECGAALVVGVDERPLSAPGSTRLSLTSLEVEWESGLGELAEPLRRRFSVALDKGRGEATAAFSCRVEARLGRHGRVADRRPAAWTEQAGEAARDAKKAPRVRQELSQIDCESTA